MQLRGDIHRWQHPLRSVLGAVETILHDLLLPIPLAHRVVLEMDPANKSFKPFKRCEMTVMTHPGRQALCDVWRKHLVDVASENMRHMETLQSSVCVLKGVDKEMIDAVQEVELQPFRQDLRSVKSFQPTLRNSSLVHLQQLSFCLEGALYGALNFSSVVKKTSRTQATVSCCLAQALKTSSAKRPSSVAARTQLGQLLAPSVRDEDLEVLQMSLPKQLICSSCQFTITSTVGHGIKVTFMEHKYSKSRLLSRPLAEEVGAPLP